MRPTSPLASLEMARALKLRAALDTDQLITRPASGPPHVNTMEWTWTGLEELPRAVPGRQASGTKAGSVAIFGWANHWIRGTDDFPRRLLSLPHFTEPDS